MKAHLIESDEPLAPGLVYEAICGASVANCRFVFTADGDICDVKLLQISMRGMCDRCRKYSLQNKRRLYGIVNGQEWIDYCSKRHIQEDVA